MQKRNNLSRFFLGLTLLTLMCAGLFTPRVEKVEAAPALLAASDIVISEFRTTGPGGGNDEFIELYNPTAVTVDISGWKLKKSTGCGAPAASPLYTFLAGTTLAPGQHVLVGGSSYSGGVLDFSATLSIADNGGIAVTTASDVIVDQVGMCATTSYIEGTNLATLTGTTNRSYERKLGGLNGSCLDNGNNSIDFQVANPSDPQNLSSPVVGCFTPPIDILINEVAWAGTLASANDEWIELYNPGVSDVDLTGWRLVSSSDGNPDIVFNSSTCIGTCVITAGSYFLLERAHDNVVQGVAANLIFTGQLSDSGEILTLTKPDASVVDTANSDGGAWPAGNAGAFKSMERVGTVADGNLSWVTFDENVTPTTAIDAGGNPIYGTPGVSNSGFGVTPTFTPSNTPTRTLTPTSTITSSPTITTTPTRTFTPLPAASMSILINEVAWSGTLASSSDEWIELYNPGPSPINLTGWKLNASDGNPAINLNSVILPVGAYYILATSSTAFNDVVVDQTFSGSLSNEGELLRLYDGSNTIIDTANSDSGAWPAGTAASGTPTYASMERRGKITDGFFSWSTFAGTVVVAHDRNNNVIKGTPGKSNWGLTVTLTPTAITTPTRTATPGRASTSAASVGRPVINEFLPRPGYDWNKDGSVDVFDEFIEIKNLGPVDINLSGWKLDDEENRGSDPYTLPDVLLKPGQRVVFYGLETNILLGDGGDTVRLLNTSNKIYDSHTYKIAKAEDRSVCRLPDGNGSWYEDCIPTPNFTNSRNGEVPSMPDGSGFESPVCSLPDTLPEAFLIAECRGYGANLWSAIFWDLKGWDGDRFVPENMSKWETFVE